MDRPSRMIFIENPPKDPVEMFSNIVTAYKTTNPAKANYIPMEVATLDEEFGVLNRTCIYRGLLDGHIIFVTENTSVKYANLMKDPRTAVSFLFEVMQENGVNLVWQVRLMGKAEELSPNQLPKLWAEEPVYCKIRCRTNICGQPVDFAKQKDAFDKLLREYENGQNSLPQTKNYTGFKIVPTVWDFYKCEPNCVADRVQYRKGQSEQENWSIIHVAS